MRWCNYLGFVRSGRCTKLWDTELSAIENRCWISHWPDDEKSKLQNPKRHCGMRISPQESKRNKAFVERSVEECIQGKAHGQCSKGESCRFSQSWPSSIWKQGQRWETKRAIVFSLIPCKGETDWRRRTKILTGIRQTRKIRMVGIRPVCELQVWKRLRMLRQMLFPTCCGDRCCFPHVEAEGSPTRSWRKVVSRISCFSAPSNSPMHLAPYQNLGERGSISMYCPKVRASWAFSLRSQIREPITWGYFVPRKIHPRCSVGFGENIHKFTNSDKTRISVLGEFFWNTEESRNKNSYTIQECRLHMMSKKKIGLRRDLDGEKEVPETRQYWLQREVHNPRRGHTNVRSWFESVCHSTTIPGNVCCRVVWQVLQRHGHSYERVIGQDHKRPKMGKCCFQDRQLRASCRSRFVCQFVSSSTTMPQQSLEPDAHQVSGNRAASSSFSDVLERSDEFATKKHGQRSLSDDEQDAKDPLADVPFWLEDFTDNVKLSQIRQNSGKIWWMMKFHYREALTPVVLMKYLKRRDVRIWVNTVFTLISPKDRNCKICTKDQNLQRPRAEDAMAKPHFVLKILVSWQQQITRSSVTIFESRNNQSSMCSRGAGFSHSIWIQAYPCKNKTSQETQRSLQKFLEPERKPKVIYTDNSLEFGKVCEDLSWNHCTCTPHRSETNGIAERAVHRVKEGTSAVLLQSGLNESWWADSMECYTYLRNVTDFLSDGKTPYERRFGKPFEGPIIPFGSLVEYHPITAKDQSRIHQFGKKSLT